MNVESIFNEAIGYDRQRRESFLHEACGDDAELRRRLDRLIAAHEKTDNFLDDVAHEEFTRAHDRPEISETAGQTIGPYKLREEIGQGGMGVVFVAEREQPIRQKVALKIVKPGMDTQDVIARFSAERQALALMDHPGIAKVLDAGSTESGRPYFVMELVKGIPITEYCDQHQLTIRERVALFIDVCLAIGHAHQKGIIHRDIKPSNVLVTEHDGRPIPKVIDFGVAKAMNQRLTEHTIYTMHRQVVGTLQYMSPEQSELSGLDIDTRSDVYALGLLLYELVTGTTPFDKATFDRASFDEKRRIIREEEPPRPSTKVTTLGESASTISSHRKTDPGRLHRQIRGDLDWILMKTLEKDRGRRYDSAVNLARDARRYLDDQPIDAGPPSPIYRFRKFARRNKFALLAALSALVVLGSVGAWLWFVATQRESRMLADSNLLSNAIENASLDLGRAESAPIGREDEWIAARSGRQRIEDLMKTTSADQAVHDRAMAFLHQFESAEKERNLATSIEEIVINQATQMDVDSWRQMESQMRDIFREQGIDFDQLSPPEVSDRIRTSVHTEQLCDLLELWIGTRAMIPTFEGKSTTAAQMQPWADAIFAADTDRVRTGIRRLIYAGTPPTRQQVEKVIEGVDLKSLSPRTLSWLASTFAQAGDNDRAYELHYIALRQHPSDVMLNFDFALLLASQQQWEKAIRFYLRCTAVRHDVPGIWRELGVCYRNNGELDRSRECLEWSIELQGDHAPSLVELAQTQIAQQDYLDAVDSLRGAIRLQPDNAEAHGYLGRALMGMQKFEEARKSLQKSKRLAESNRKFQLPIDDWLGECLESMKQK